MAKQICLSVLAAAILWNTTILCAHEGIPALVHKEGDTWQFNISRKGQIKSSTGYDEGIYELSIMQGVVKVYDINGGQKKEKTVRRDGAGQGLLRLVGKSDQGLDLKFPLSVGQNWTYEIITRSPGSNYSKRRYTEINVVGIEQVTTPAGSFKAFKLVRSESWVLANWRDVRGSVTTTYFYSPVTRSIVKSSSVENPGTVEIELIKFTPGN